MAAASLVYVGGVFHLRDGEFGSHAIGDWMDPYFINGLLEHWNHAVRTLTDPASPPMYFPATGTIGYSHSLILYAPFYVPLRLFLHPFQAYNATVFLVMVVGIVSLYALLRRMQLSIAEAAVLTAFFASSQNVVNGTTGVWTQRASVFLLPPILLLGGLLARSERRRLMSAFGVAFLATLIYAHDFYTAHFAVLLAAGLLAPFLPVTRMAEWLRAYYAGQPAPRRWILAIAAVATAATALVMLTGGFDVRPFGVRFSMRDWRRPAVLALASLAIFAWRARELPGRDLLALLSPWSRGLCAGAMAGALIFVWMYASAYADHSGFGKDDIWAALVTRDGYLSQRVFVLASALVVIGAASTNGHPALRRFAAVLAVMSVLVFVTPYRFNRFSPWLAFVAHLPGMGIIRDPKRIIYLYELAVVLAAGWMLPQSRRLYRAGVTLMALLFVVLQPNRNVFDYERANAVFDKWVAAPIAIDPVCASFYIKGASADYMSRSPHMGTLYGNDALYIALRHSIPTLNGYSAWSPPEWELWNPQEDTYPGRVRTWIARHRLTNVCELDIDARVMAPAR